MSLPLDLRLAIAPLATYRQLVADPEPGSWWRTIERLALVALIVGLCVTLSSARTVPLGLVLMGVLIWSFVPLLQMLAAIALSTIPSSRPVSLARALELLFIGHLPWSLWILIVSGLEGFTSKAFPQSLELLSLLIPAVWTAVIVSAFCRVVLGCTSAVARRLTAGHQAVTWTLFMTYVFLTSGLWPRIVALVGR